MTKIQSSQTSATSKSMIEADTANGEGPDSDQREAPPRSGLDERAVTHPTGTRQAEENLENDPPA
jgi:hypothetical protein